MNVEKYLPAIQAAADDVCRKADYGGAAIKAAFEQAHRGFVATVRKDLPGASTEYVEAFASVMLDGVGKFAAARMQHETAALKADNRELATMAPPTLPNPANDG